MVAAWRRFCPQLSAGDNSPSESEDGGIKTCRSGGRLEQVHGGNKQSITLIIATFINAACCVQVPAAASW